MSYGVAGGGLFSSNVRACLSSARLITLRALFIDENNYFRSIILFDR
jgi:hypothetical protein